MIRFNLTNWKCKRLFSAQPGSIYFGLKFDFGRFWWDITQPGNRGGQTGRIIGSQFPGRLFKAALNGINITENLITNPSRQYQQEIILEVGPLSVENRDRIEQLTLQDQNIIIVYRTWNNQDNGWTLWGEEQGLRVVDYQWSSLTNIYTIRLETVQNTPVRGIDDDFIQEILEPIDPTKLCSRPWEDLCTDEWAVLCNLSW